MIPFGGFFVKHSFRLSRAAAAGAAVAAAGAQLRIDGFDPSHVLELRLLEVEEV